MINTGRIVELNRWYDRQSSPARFHLILWPLLTVFVLNMIATVLIRFPFGLLPILCIAALVAIRAPYRLGLFGKRERPADGDAARPFQVTAPDWVMAMNRRYETIPEKFRLWVILAGLLLVGAINMTLTIHHLFPFGLLFLLVFLALFAIRGPYVAGWLKTPVPDAAPPEDNRRPLALVELPSEEP